MDTQNNSPQPSGNSEFDDKKGSFEFSSDNSPVSSPLNQETAAPPTKTLAELDEEYQHKPSNSDQFTTKKLITALVSVFALLTIGFGGAWYFYNSGYSGILYESNDGFSIEIPEGFEVVDINDLNSKPPLSYTDGFRDQDNNRITISKIYSTNFAKDVERFEADFSVAERQDKVINNMRAVSFRLASGDEEQVHTLIEGSDDTTYLVQAASSTLDMQDLMIDAVETFTEGPRVASTTCYSFDMPLLYPNDVTVRETIVGDYSEADVTSKCRKTYLVTGTIVNNQVFYSNQGSEAVMLLSVSQEDLVQGNDLLDTVNALVEIAESVGAEVEQSEVTVDGVVGTAVKWQASQLNRITGKPTSYHQILLPVPENTNSDIENQFIFINYLDSVSGKSDNVINSVLNTWDWETN